MATPLALPPLAPTRRRLLSALCTIEESTQLDRWVAQCWHMGAVEEWIHDQTWISHHGPTPQVVTEIETTLVAPLEAALITRWGFQAVLL